MTGRDDKLRRLHAWAVDRRKHAGVRQHPAWDALLAEIERLLAEQPAPNHEGDEVLREFLVWAKRDEEEGKLDEGLLALSELARRALADSAQRQGGAT